MTPNQTQPEGATKDATASVPYRILVAVDFSPTSTRALGLALEQARGKHRAELHVACVIDKHGSVETPHGGEVSMTVEDLLKMLRKLVVDTLSAAGVKGDAEDRPRVHAHVRVGSPSREILALADETNADLLVVGTHGRHGLERLWLGSVAERVVRLAPCPVLVVRPKSQDPKSLDAYQPEPACPKCLAKRAETNGREWWCDEHASRSPEEHVYRYSSTLDYEADLYKVLW